jgi:hypothetical protein
MSNRVLRFDPQLSYALSTNAPCPSTMIRCFDARSELHSIRADVIGRPRRGRDESRANRSDKQVPREIQARNRSKGKAARREGTLDAMGAISSQKPWKGRAAKSILVRL